MPMAYSTCLLPTPTVKARRCQRPSSHQVLSECVKGAQRDNQMPYVTQSTWSSRGCVSLLYCKSSACSKTPEVADEQQNGQLSAYRNRMSCLEGRSAMREQCRGRVRAPQRRRVPPWRSHFSTDSANL